MAEPIKRKKLLTKETGKKKLSQPKAQPSPQQTQLDKQRAEYEKKQLAEKKAKAAKIKFSLLALLVVIYIIIPKPQVLVYEKLNMVSESIYWPGFTKEQAIMLDTNQQVIIDEQLNIIYFCYRGENKQNCQKYTLIERKGMFAAAKLYFSNH
ncbi:hypothetical protein [Flocculibacter collagenilyticus]|uniref:hypothetical protein n=1 Tax=Flocculibacter collagenilyticus TaxID=2744479 RepID=UPI0018F5AE0E|nr:hypothetical protein [Flocculibacter collagenilyticus]